MDYGRRILARMKIYTRTGDKGETSLLGGSRVRKSDPRVAAYGDVDELCAVIGVVRGEADLSRDIDDLLQHVQRDLFAIGAQLADPSAAVSDRVAKAAVGDQDVARLEQWIDGFEDTLPPLRRFILPGGSGPGAALHFARTVCRRAERGVVGLGREDHLVTYLNRLSDLLFVLARTVNHRMGRTESEW
jgi:cob(I)alamin adenosyltransferase